MIVKETYSSLDGLRAFACIAIVLMHVQKNIISPSSDNFITSNLIGFAGNFVLLFMMISAFSMCCGYYERFINNQCLLEQFYKKRYSRIWPFFALLVFLDVAQALVSEHFSFTDVMKAELCEAFADLTLLFGLLPDANISVIGVGWFWGVIFVFYLLFPFFCFLISNAKRAWLSLVVSIVMFFLAVNYFSSESHVVRPISDYNIVYCAPYFIVGGLIYRTRNIFKNLRVRYSVKIMVVVYTVLFFVFPVFRIDLVSNILLYAGWIAYAISEREEKRKWTFLNNRFVAFLSRISMEVYLCHMMFFRVVEKGHLERFLPGNATYIVTCALVLMGAVVFASLYKRFESLVKSKFGSECA